MSKNTKNATENTQAQSMISVANVLEGLKYDEAKYSVIRCYDNEEFNEGGPKERASYANIRSNVDNRAIIKLWGHKTHVAVECSKMLRKRENIDVAKKMYTAKATDKNNNYICKTYAEAIELANDFITQVTASVYTEKTTATEKKTTKKQAK